MPTISMFYGIIIRMYCSPKEHGKPHIHAYYQENSAVFDIDSAEIIAGDLPKRQKRLVTAWIEVRKEELLADWKLSQNGEIPLSVPPLS